MAFTQQRSRIAVSSPLGGDELVLTRVEGVERLSQLFSYRLGMLSENDAIAAKSIVGEAVCITLLDTDDEPRFIHGIVRGFVNHGRSDRATIYSAEVVPWLWLLTRRTDCRIFQEMTVPQIIQKVFDDLGFSDYDVSGLSGSYDKLEYCVQYRETDFDFVARLMEHEGIFYYFAHEADKHTLVLADHTGAYQPNKHASVRYLSSDSFAEVDDHIVDWQHRFEFKSGKVAMHDYNFKTPQQPVTTKEKTVISLPGNDKFELFDYPGDYLERGGGDRRARIRMQEVEAGHDGVVGVSKCRFFSPGTTFTLAEHHQPHEVGQTYVLTSVRHQADDSGYVTGAEKPFGYQNEFECIPAKVLYRPARERSKSIVAGPQTAMVVGPAGEEIYTDEFGRVKVQFPWDRYGQNNENSSCWIRVSQSWAGKDFGGLAIPRIGQEVIVEFLEGDPDRPIITGRVYNADKLQSQSLPASQIAGPTGNKPIPEMQGRAAGLPAAKTRTTFKSNSTPGGGGANEIAFDDAAGSELLFVNATKDAVRTVGNNDRTHIGNDQQLSVVNNVTEFIGGTDDLTIVGDTTIKITKGVLDHDVETGTATYHVKSDVTENFDATQKTTVANEIVITSKGAHIHATAATEIKLEVGLSTLLMKSDGSIELKGVNIAIDGAQSVNTHGMSITTKADIDHNISGTIVKSEAAAVNTVKGAMVMLNP